MNKYDWKITVLFTGEILSFVLIGYSLALDSWGYAILSTIFAMIIAGMTGKLIEKRAIENYIEKEKGGKKKE